MVTKNQIKNFFEAAMIADALGVPVEFCPRDSYTVTNMQGHGTYDQPAGSWSDDSSLTLCLAETLTASDTPDDLMGKFTRYMESGDYTPNGELFDIGGATRQAVINYVVNQTPAVEAGSRSPYANGNGALMRIMPLAFSTRCLRATQRAEIVTAYTTVTHGHVRSIIASILYIECLCQQLAGVPLVNALRSAWEFVATSDFPTEELAYFKREHDPTLGTLSREQIHSSGYVIDTFEAALWCALNGHTLADVTLLAVNLGEDTDTIAEIATCLYVANHLDEIMPTNWRQTLIKTDQARSIINDFATKFADH